jgi:hypothetical protein
MRTDRLKRRPLPPPSWRLTTYYLLAGLLIAGLGFFSVTYRTLTQTSNNLDVSSSKTNKEKEDLAIIDHFNETKPCWRPCKNRRNIIIYRHPTPEGISDRHTIIAALADLAGSLCATLLFPPPTEMLAARHNHGNLVDPKVQWSDFFHINFLQDASPALYQLSLHSSVENQESYYQKSSSGPATIVQDWEELETRSWQQDAQSFLWTVPYWYDVAGILGKAMQQRSDSYLPAISGNQEGCRYTEESTAPVLAQAAHTIWNEIQQTSPRNATIGFFHIRRTDATKECLTILPKIDMYLSCSFEMIRPGQHNITILFASDAPSPVYRQGIRDRIEKYGMVFVDLDRMVEQHLVAEQPAYLQNNFVTYQIETLLQWKASFRLERRRKVACNDCDEVLL